MLDLPLTKKKKKKTGFNLDAALDFKSPDEEKNDESGAVDGGNAAESAGANQDEDFDLDMDFSKMKKKKKSKKVIEELLPEKTEEEKVDDKENGKDRGQSPLVDIVSS